MNTPEWLHEFQQEIEQAEAAREVGKEGMARVCARRAAGVVVSEYYQQKGVDLGKIGAYDRLRYLINQADTQPEIRQVAEHFVLRVTPERALPVDADLIAEARWLLTTLIRPLNPR
jgi:HEPN domain-containing protein